jgi:hypothetical protein
MPESRPLPASAASEVAEARGGDVWIAREEETGNGGRTDGGGTDAARKRSALLGKEGDQEREGEAFTLGGGGLWRAVINSPAARARAGRRIRGAGGRDHAVTDWWWWWTARSESNG